MITFTFPNTILLLQGNIKTITLIIDLSRRVKNFQQIAGLFKPSLELVPFFTGIRATVQDYINSLAVCFKKKCNKKIAFPHAINT